MEIPPPIVAICSGSWPAASRIFWSASTRGARAQCLHVHTQLIYKVPCDCFHLEDQQYARSLGRQDLVA